MPAPTLVLGAPCWIDLFSSDTARAKDFYGRLFGWTTMDPGPEYGGYFLFQRDGKVVAGCMANDGSMGGPDTWTLYLHTDDADRTVESAKAMGAPVYVEPMDVTQNGRMAMVADPGGAAIGIWEPKEVSGFEVRGEVGTGVVTYAPLGYGMLSGAITMDTTFEEGDHRAPGGDTWSELFVPEQRERALALVDAMRPVAERLGVTPAQLALAWNFMQPGVTSAIAGSRDPDHVDMNAAAGDVELDAETLAELDALLPLGPTIVVDEG